MDILKRGLAPISDEAWQEIDDRAKEVLTNLLSARKVVNVQGPKGWDFTVVPEGRVEIDDKIKGNVKTGVYKVKPLVEARVTFELNKWELDNIARGAKDIELENLENAVKDLALFEENAVYNGYKTGSIEGLKEVAKTTLEFGEDGDAILNNLSEALLVLKNAYVKKPFTLIVSEDAYKKLNTLYNGYLLKDVVKQLIEGDVIVSEALEGALLLPFDHADLEFTIGQDFSIGYETHTDEVVKFFVTESFTFRTLDEAIIINFK